MAEETGATKSKNPHEPSLGRFLRGRERHVNTGYVGSAQRPDPAGRHLGALEAGRGIK